jgi:hypothetical protein
MVKNSLSFGTSVHYFNHLLDLDHSINFVFRELDKRTRKFESQLMLKK